MRDFNKWLKTFKSTLADWTYYTDFEKIYKNVNDIKIELNILNSLIGSKNIEEDFKVLVEKYPEVLKVIPILLAKRDDTIEIITQEGDIIFDFKESNFSAIEYSIFMRNTGLFDLLENHIISDLTDYVKGVEVGLDTNARKNRTGKSMQKHVEEHLISLGFEHGKSLFSEMSAIEIEKIFGVKVSSIQIENRANKRFDFVVRTPNMVYGIETNFYSSSGSKLNETARSYKMLAQEAENLKGFTFIWITDGRGWNYAKNNLQEMFDSHKHVYNINDLKEGKLKEVLK